MNTRFFLLGPCVCVFLHGPSFVSGTLGLDDNVTRAQRLRAETFNIAVGWGPSFSFLYQDYHMLP